MSNDRRKYLAAGGYACMLGIYILAYVITLIDDKRHGKGEDFAKRKTRCQLRCFLKQ